MRFLRRADDSAHDTILAHYRRTLPGREVVSVPWTPEHMANRLPDLHLTTLKPAKKGQFWIFATIGAWQATEETGHGMEFVAVARTKDKAVMTQLGQLAYYHAGPPENRLGVGHTLSLGEGWVPGFPLEAVLVSLPYLWGPALEHCRVGRRHVQVLWVLPIYEEERAFAREHGLDALERRFTFAHLDYLDPFRKSLA